MALFDGLCIRFHLLFCCVIHLYVYSQSTDFNCQCNNAGEKGAVIYGVHDIGAEFRCILRGSLPSEIW